MLESGCRMERDADLGIIVLNIVNERGKDRGAETECNCNGERGWVLYVRRKKGVDRGNCFGWGCRFPAFRLFGVYGVGIANYVATP